eukprot:Seg6403.3 transcript_id=Seg6403.3/GoldUCD/mRNA.D3Y31 product="hypothetical protein" protein_id=Seg6403.3/GoldUCD/D3Y31
MQHRFGHNKKLKSLVKLTRKRGGASIVCGELVSAASARPFIDSCMLAKISWMNFFIFFKFFNLQTAKKYFANRSAKLHLV